MSSIQKTKILLDQLQQQLTKIEASYPSKSSLGTEMWLEAYQIISQLKQALEPSNPSLPSSEKQISSTFPLENLDFPFDTRNKTKRLVPPLVPPTQLTPPLVPPAPLTPPSPSQRFSTTKRVRKLTPPSSSKSSTTPWITAQECSNILGISIEKLEELVAQYSIQPIMIQGRQMFSSSEITWLKESLLKQGREEDEHEYPSGGQLTDQFQFIEEQGSLFLVETRNPDYNTQNLLAIITQKLQKNNPKALKLLRELHRVLLQRERLFAYSINIVEKEMDSAIFWELCKDPNKWEQWSSILLGSNLLARYYSDLALMRLAVIILRNDKLPINICSLLPRNVLELSDNIVWPPFHIDMEQRQLLKNYIRHDKIWFILERLHDNCPIEFDLEQMQLPEYE